ncbi:MAG: hypothetical protein ACE5G2_06970 [Candidatus Krumholzibacteriia bacterium]
MTTIRWLMAAVAIFGGLTAIATALFTLLLLVGRMHVHDDGVWVYWLCAAVTITFLGVWLLIVVWCYIDAERRAMNAPLWALLILVLSFPIGPLLYLVLRHPLPEQRPPSPNPPSEPSAV